MFGLAQARAHNGSRHGGLVQHPARRDVGNRHPVFQRDGMRRPQHALQGGPAAHGVNEAAVFHLAPVAHFKGCFLAQPALTQEAATERAVGQQPDIAREAQLRHCAGSAPVQQRQAHLVGGNGQPVRQQYPQVRGVEIGQADVFDQAFSTQCRKLGQGIQITRVLKRPPVELHQIDAARLHTLARPLNARANAFRRHRARIGAPLGEGLDGRFQSGALPQQMPGDDFGRTVMVGHVKGIKTCLCVICHGGGCALWVQQLPGAFHVCHLPQASDDARNLQPRRQQGSVNHRADLACLSAATWPAPPELRPWSFARW